MKQLPDDIRLSAWPRFGGRSVWPAGFDQLDTVPMLCMSGSLHFTACKGHSGLLPALSSRSGVPAACKRCREGLFAGRRMGHARFVRAFQLVWGDLGGAGAAEGRLTRTDPLLGPVDRTDRRWMKYEGDKLHRPPGAGSGAWVSCLVDLV